MATFLEKHSECEGFEQIVDFLNAPTKNYALIVNPTIYAFCIEQLWATAKAKTINGEEQLQALVDRKKKKGGKGFSESYILISNHRWFKLQEEMDDSGPTEPIADEVANEENIPTHSNDLLLSGEDRLKLNELMELCTNLQKKVLDLETSKTSQAEEIASLKRRVKKLEKKQRYEVVLLKVMLNAKKEDDEVNEVEEMNPKDLKTKSFANVQELFDKAMKRVNTFIDMDTELLEDDEIRVEGNETKEESSSKRAGDELESDKSKKQKLDEKVGAEVDDAKEAEELKQFLEIVPNDWR
ncbi:hypothetical protein Tco_0948509 [Tanacetum coccineum]